MMRVLRLRCSKNPVRQFPLLAFFLLALSLPLARAETSEKPDKLAGLQQELVRVQKELAEAQARLSEDSKALWNTQHKLEYNDPESAKLREEIKALEKQMHEKRRELSARMSQVPEMKDIRKARTELFKKIETLRDDERLLQNEIKALQLQAPAETP